MIILLRLPESQTCELDVSPEQPSVRKVLGQEQTDCYELKAGAELSAREILLLPKMSLLMSLHFFVYLAFSFFYISFPVHAATRLQWSLAETGVFFAVMGLLMATVQGPVLARVSKRWPDGRLVVGGSLILATSFLGFTSDSVSLIYAGTVLLAVGNGVMWPSLQAVISTAAGPQVQGAVQGFAGGLAAVASIIGLVVGGVLYGLVGVGVFVLAAFVAGAVFLMSALYLPASRTPSRGVAA